MASPRKHRGHPPLYVYGRLTLEAAVIVVPGLILGVLVWFAFR